MFNSQILEVQNKLTKNLLYTTTKGLNCTGADMDLQYELYSKYMHLSKQQIVIKELLLMRDSQSLLDTIGGSGKFSQSKDASSTMDSLSYDQDFDHSIMQQFSCTDRRTPRKLTRKGTRHSAMKASGRRVQQFNQMLLQIERHCSSQTYCAVKSLLDQHKKNMSQIIQVQKKYKNLHKMEQKTEKAQEENLVLKMKLNQVEEKLKIKDQEIKGLKQRLNQLKLIEKEYMRTPQKSYLSAKTITQSLQQPKLTSNFHQTNFLTTYLNIKQTSIQKRMTKIQSIETKIQSDIENSVLNSNLNETACNKCCQMIKKIKQSVINYRTYLEDESSECQTMYNMLKKEVEQCIKNNNVQLANI